MFKKLVFSVFLLFVTFICAQNKVRVTGIIYNEYLETFSNAKVTNSLGKSTTSDTDGEFTIEIEAKLPQFLKITSEGYQVEIVQITSFDKETNIILKESSATDQIVMSASRISERIIESPVTIERMSLTDIKKNPANSSYEGLGNLKEISVNNLGYVYSSINTRGFSSLNNKRFVQLIDGMDTALPSLSYSLGNIMGVSNLDIQSIEVLPGASSALYGANAYNGLMLTRTKSPFDYSGVSTKFKSGITNAEVGGRNAFYDVSVRAAYKFSEAFAAKVNFGYVSAEEWEARDYRNIEDDTHNVIPGEFGVPGYMGINIYGDTYSGSIKRDNVRIRTRRTGYKEADLLKDNKINNIAFSSALHFRPLKKESLEIILGLKSFKVNNLIQGRHRYALRNFKFNQSKLEVKGDNFYVRGYYNKNDMGDSYSLEETGYLLTNKTNRNEWKGRLRGYLNDNVINFSKLTSEEFISAVEFADIVSLQPGTPQFNKAFNDIIANNKEGQKGSKLYDKSGYWNFDGNYNFSSLINNWADIQVGGSFRKYKLDSKGTLFNDLNRDITIEEYGAYTQIQKKLFDDRLKFTGSLRYDKSSNFEQNISPRLSITHASGKNKNHILRASFQTGFRNPTIEEQYTFIRSGYGNLIGSASDNIESVEFAPRIFTAGVLTKAIYRPQYTEKAGGSIIKSDYQKVAPENVKTFEVGYKSLVSLTNAINLYVDFNTFYNKHGNFIFQEDITVYRKGNVNPDITYAEYQTQLNDLKNDTSVNQGWVERYENLATIGKKVVLDWEAFLTTVDNTRTRPKVFSLITNAKSEVTSFGFGLALRTKVFQDLELGANYNFMDYSYEDEDLAFEPNFNTPKHTVKFSIGHDKVFGNFGFNINAKWQDKYKFISNMGAADVDARTLFDAQINYTVSSIKSRFKLGGTNLFGKEYQVAPGMGNIGQVYYLSWVIND